MKRYDWSLLVDVRYKEPTLVRLPKTFTQVDQDFERNQADRRGRNNASNYARSENDQTIPLPEMFISNAALGDFDH